LAEFGGIALGDQLESLPPARMLLVTPDRRAAAVIGEMLQATWSDGRCAMRSSAASCAFTSSRQCRSRGPAGSHDIEALLIGTGEHLAHIQGSRP
jgi:hypothetical protein